MKKVLLTFTFSVALAATTLAQTSPSLGSPKNQQVTSSGTTPELEAIKTAMKKEVARRQKKSDRKLRRKNFFLMPHHRKRAMDVLANATT